MSERRNTNTKETPKLQRIFEYQRRQERRQPKRTKMASGTVTNTGRHQKLQRRCNELTRSCACNRRSGDRSCCIGLRTVRLRRGHVGRAKLERDQTKSNKIKRNQDLTLASPRVCPCLKLMYLSPKQEQTRRSSSRKWNSTSQRSSPWISPIDEASKRCFQTTTVAISGYLVSSKALYGRVES